MANFVNMQGNKCGNVIVIANADIQDLPFPESEPVGQAFIASIGIEGTWLQTSYSGSFRGTYAGLGWTYDAELDTFVAPVTPE